MARSYVSQYHRFRRLEDLDMAIEQLGEAVRLAPDGHLDKSLFLAELGHLHHHHYHHSEDSPQLHQSISCFKRAAQSTTGKASTRFQASQEWAEISFDHKIGESSVIEAHQQAIALIPQVVWFGKTVKSRYESTKEVSKAVTKAFRVAVALKRCDLALEWLEAGRSVVWTQMLQLRTPLDDLRSRDSDLATKLQRIARELERAGLESLEKTQVLKDSATLEETAQCRRHLAVQWEQLTAQIRQISGFHDFMRPKTFQDFRKADLKRTLVVINVHDEKSHAIALHPHWAHGIHMPLPSLTLRGASEMRRKLLNLLQGVQVRGSTGRRPIYPASDGAYEFESVMKLLWTDVVRPVLDGLGFLVRVDRIAYTTKI
ncbi:hypothetical protein FS749_007730 [Ceratobasidium sp. UAMH 11750]|nr:hypothetical protein FS749_007730 [Ceratobasidium sp. UAMH 11750]